MAEEPYLTYKHHSVAAADKTLNIILDLIHEGTWDWNARTGHVNRNPGWYRMLGYEVGIFRQDVFTWENIIHPDDYDHVMKTFEDYTQGRTDKYLVEYRCRKADGDYLWITDSGRIIERNSDGTVARMIGTHQNIHAQKTAQAKLIEQNKLLQEGKDTLEKTIKSKTVELKKRNQQLKEKIAAIKSISNLDPLTKIANRKKFEEQLHREVFCAVRYKHPLSLAIFDIDLFKNINDTHGHKMGDAVLKKLTSLVSANIREIDFFGRWGGEEFVLIFPDLHLAEANKACDKLRRLINQDKNLPNIPISCSFGVTTYTSGNNIEDLFSKADTALYRAKEAGRDCVMCDD